MWPVLVYYVRNPSQSFFNLIFFMLALLALPIVMLTAKVANNVLHKSVSALIAASMYSAMLWEH